jgi:hypothetical protein
MHLGKTSQRAAIAAIIVNVLNTTMSVVLYCIPLNSGGPSPSALEGLARTGLWCGTLCAPFLFIIAAGLLLLALVSGLPTEKRGEFLTGLAGVSFIASLPMLIIGIMAWLGSFTLVR